MFVGWLHDLGYGFYGDRPIGGMVPQELDMLLLHHLIKKEEQEDAGSSHSKSRHSTRQKAQEISEKQ